MDGTNSAGRKVSLLNDHEPQLVRLSSFTPSLRSRTSSYATSSVGSPPTPQLVRSRSSDSMDFQSPSPITPDFYGTAPESPEFSQAGFFQPQQKDLNSQYPPMSLPYHPGHQVHPSQVPYFGQQPPQEQHAAPPAPPTANGRPKKNQYPCPMAKEANCSDHFTTSGHAARHAKKHTGKKDAFCPECNKAFTRKDNMEQHRRTHQGNRSHAKSSDKESKKAKSRAQRPKPSPLQSSTPVVSPAPVVDPTLPISPAGSLMTTPVQPSEGFIEFAQRTYPDPTSYAMAYSYNPAPSHGNSLDVLASAASDEHMRHAL